MHTAIADKKAKLIELCRQYHVAHLEVFGSATRSTGFDPQTSDVDFLVEFEPETDLSPFDQFFDFTESLKTVLGRRVDLVEAVAINNPYLRTAINKSRELVYAS